MSFEPFTGFLNPGKNTAFQHTSILVRPLQKPGNFQGLWWSRRVLPPGPLCLLHSTIYCHSQPKPTHPI